MDPEPKPSLTSVLNRLLGHLVTSRRSIMAEWADDRDYLLKQIEHIETDRNNLALAVEKLQQERDEARREVCTWQGLESGRGKEHVAVARGWNDLKFHDPSALDRIAKLDEEMGLL